ncbi:MAG: tetratricopeptide repeat protein [Verrucomicrobiia bacterium]
MAAVCALVIGVYAYVAQSRVLELLSPNAADTYYNLLVQGFRDGHLSVKKEVPTGFARLPDPYDPAANRVYWGPPYGIGDLSYYKGRLYLYFGVTPALMLFWPVAALTGHYLFYGQAVTIFCAVGFLASVGVLCAVWRRYFSEVSVWAVAACALGLALATGVPLLLERCGVYEVAISCGYMLTMLALGAIWCALHEREGRWRWLAAASVAYGLAVGARPNLLFGAVALLVPVAQAWHERRQVWPMLAAATIPITLIGLGLMLYNELRFDNPLEFGWHYQLAGEQHVTRQLFNPHYLWFNFRVYLLKPARWSSRFPFVREIALPPVPAGYGGVESPFGVLTNIPLVWLTLAVPLAWRGRSGQAGSVLRWFGAAVALLFGTCVLPLLFFISAVARYEVEFLPAPLLLAAVGIFGLERALADRPLWRRAARWGWSLLLAFSVAFNLFACVVRCAEPYNNLGDALYQTGKREEAIEHYQQALRINPDYAEAHYKLGVALYQTGKREEAIEHLQQALRINPDYAEAHYNLGVALYEAGKREEGIEHFQQALRFKPDYAEAHNNLGVSLAQAGKIEEAVAHFQRALRINPDYAEAHYNLGNALAQVGRVPEAIAHYEQALRIKPDFTQAQNALARLQARQ